jgi:hypothetical protein
MLVATGARRQRTIDVCETSDGSASMHRQIAATAANL